MTSLAELRRARGWTQAEVAKRVGVSESAIRMYELGLRTPRYAVAKKLAALYGVPMESLQFGAGAQDTPDAAVQQVDQQEQDAREEAAA